MKPPLVLQNIRIHGLGNVLDSQWIRVGEGITFFQLPQDFNTGGFIHTLQSINPPHSLADGGIFQNHPKIIRQGKYQKRVRPEKRTVAFAIFIAQPQFVQELADITPHLYEADRIEVGRRLDYSRWVNFVEIASSTRWSEVDEQLLHLADTYSETVPHSLSEKLSLLEKTDRIEDELKDSLGLWLENLKKGPGKSRTDEIEELFFAVNRQNHFNDARHLVRRHLPVFHLADNERLASYAESEARSEKPSNLLQTLISDKANAEFGILLVNETAMRFDNSRKEQLRCFLKETSRHFQILYFLSRDTGEGLPDGSRVVGYEEMVSGE